MLRRDTGAVGIADILSIVVVADASQNAMSIAQVCRAIMESDGNFSVVTDEVANKRAPDIAGRPGS